MIHLEPLIQRLVFAIIHSNEDLIMKKLTLEQAYAATYIFLEQQNFTINSDDLSVMLSDMMTLEGAIPADVAVWIYWAIAASCILGEVCINKIMKPVIKAWRDKGIDVDIAVNSKNILFILAVDISHLNSDELENIIEQQSTNNSLLNIFSKLRGYEQIVFRVSNMPTIQKKLWVIADKEKMEKLMALYRKQ